MQKRVHSSSAIAVAATALVAVGLLPTSISQVQAAELTIQLDGTNPYSDTTTPAPVNGVAVHVQAGAREYTGTTTDGKVHFTDVPAGDVTLTFPNTPGYVTGTFALTEPGLVVYPKWAPQPATTPTTPPPASRLTPGQAAAIGTVATVMASILGAGVVTGLADAGIIPAGAGLLALLSGAGVGGLANSPLGDATPPPPAATSLAPQPQPATGRLPDLAQRVPQTLRELPLTGADITLILLAGGTLTLIGLFLIAGRRRRHDNQ